MLPHCHHLCCNSPFQCRREVNRLDPLTMVLSHTPTSFPESDFSEAHLISAPSFWISTSLWFLIWLFFCILILHPCLHTCTHPFSHTLANFSLAKSLAAVPLSILYLMSHPAFSICNSLHLCRTIHCLPLRMNADKEANVDEMMLRVCFHIEGRVQEVGVVNWDLEGQLPTD